MASKALNPVPAPDPIATEEFIGVAESLFTPIYAPVPIATPPASPFFPVVIEFVSIPTLVLPEIAPVPIAILYPEPASWLFASLPIIISFSFLATLELPKAIVS